MLLTRRWLAALLALAGCDDGWQAEAPVRLPDGMPPGATDPRRWALAEASAAFADRPQALRGNPAALARAAALVEYLATAFQDGREADGRQLTRKLREGRTPLRHALGLAADMLPQAAADQLLAAASGGPPPPGLATADPAAEALAPLRRALRATRDALEAQQYIR